MESVLGTKMSIEVRCENNGKRYFHGLVAGFSQVGVFGRLHHYQAVLRPWLWFLSRAADCRIFQHKKTPDILKQVFQAHGFSDVKESLTGSYREREYCVQYRETDFNFVSRLMEEEGIYYYFDHQSDKHQLVLCDSPTAHQPFSGYNKVRFVPSDDKEVKQEHVNQWRLSSEVQTVKYVLREFDYLNPKADLEAKTSVSRKHALADFEYYDYPGQYVKANEGEQCVKTRLEELQSGFESATASGPIRGAVVGAKFKLDRHPRGDQNREYVVKSATYQFETHEYGSGLGEGGELFHCQFTAFQSDSPYRVSRLVPKPFVQGPQTALVVGKQGEEIWTDEHGRVKVQFHWDRVGKRDENSSCWVRVASPWAGAGWGALQLPRIGQEVVVDFIEGDPDRPIITGRVYNADNKPPCSLPADKTQSTVKSRSSKDGNPQTFNELRFEDKKDQEQVYFHAERDFQRIVENNDSLKVGFDKKDQGDQAIEVFNNQSLKVGCSQAADGSQTIEIWKDRTQTIKQGNESLQVAKGNRSVAVDTGNDTKTVKQGNISVKASAGEITIEAAQAITLKVGGSTIKMEPAQITISAPQIAVKGDAKVEVSSLETDIKADVQLKLEGLMCQLTASAIAQIKGALVQIN